MWIIPKTLSQYVPATPGLNLELSEQAWMLEQSVTWRSKFMSKQYWLKRWKKGDYVQHLCGLMPKPSLHQSFVEKYTASLPDIPVSHFQAQESEKAKKTQDTCGPTSESMSGQLDLFGACLKMSEVTPRWGYGESCPIWKKMVTERSSDCSQRRKQARLTNASDASSWPTPRAGTLVRKDGNRGAIPGSRKPGTGGKILAEEAKKNWPTPTAMSRPRSEETMEKCLKFRKSKGKNTVPLYLEEEIRIQEAKIHNGPPAPEKSSTSGKNHGSPKLNPNWVEQLMGLPIGWTDLGSWATESSPKPQK